ncbi:SH3 domain-binding protein 4-like [Takifugu flavidus]|uniref:SH3 domain-binding protein 4 n=1 Tax=Takifugu flavidus TaxID=433684 RepID=A0A5C6PP03_9TELE|nr:SH3 domain-binding protein 4-like [Takifugu flavidus]XP_056884216.1 SH3 domain-binding protein 4-like [Takifugu flavidus]XP_056884225.1 SH3 domain-binding protein 4-like [Takifugu flavidus]TWW81203.1 SH3 domain-binding protein 4 [Takifugu flavidus]
MAAHRIRATTTNGSSLPRCKSEGTLIDLSEGVSEASLADVKTPSPSALQLHATASFGTAKEVIAIKDYSPSSFTTLKFSKGDRLFVLDSSGGEWWYAHNNTEMGYIPAAYVQPISYRDSSLSDSGMIDTVGECNEDAAKELDFVGEWPAVHLKPATFQNGNSSATSHTSTNPFLNGGPENSRTTNEKSVDLLLFDAAVPSVTTTTSSTNTCISNMSPFIPIAGMGEPLSRDNPFFRSKRSYSLSELSILQSHSDNQSTSNGFFNGLKAPVPEQFQRREDFRTAWLTHRKLARSCHDLDSLGQNPGWGQTQPVETNIACVLDSSGGNVELPDTNISVHIPEGHVALGDTQQISLKALLDTPLQLNNDRCTTLSPVVEIKLSNMETKTPITLEMKVSVVVKTEAKQTTDVLCVRSDCKEGPYAPIQAYVYGDTVQVCLDNLEPCMYMCVVAQSQVVSYDSTIWEQVLKKITLGVYGPKHIHPSFKTVVAMFGHDCAPKTLLVNEASKQMESAPSVVLQLWGKHQFVISKPQDLHVGIYSNMANYEVKASEQSRVVRGFQVKLGKVSRLVYVIASRNTEDISDFTLRIQIKDDQDCILAQFCVQTPTPPPKTGPKSSIQRRFLKKKEVGKIVLSPLAITTKYPIFQDRKINKIKFGKLIKTVIRQTKNQYLLEYKKGDFVALLSEEKVKLKGQLWTKEWYIGYYQGKIGFVHAKNVLVIGRIKPICISGPELTTSLLVEQILKPSKFLTYIYASVRTILMENIGNWRAFADALGYVDVPLAHFCHTELDSEPERVASVLEKLKEDCNNTESKERKSFQKELLLGLLKMDCQGLVARLVMDFVLLTTAVEVAGRWRELAEKLVKVSRQQMDAYEAPHRDGNGVVDSEAMWKPAYDFLVTWASQIGDSYRDVIQELHTGLDKMKNPITKRWKHLTGTLILVNCLEILRCSAFSPATQGEDAI